MGSPQADCAVTVWLYATVCGVSPSADSAVGPTVEVASAGLSRGQASTTVTSGLSSTWRAHAYGWGGRKLGNVSISEDIQTIFEQFLKCLHTHATMQPIHAGYLDTCRVVGYIVASAPSGPTLTTTEPCLNHSTQASRT